MQDDYGSICNHKKETENVEADVVGITLHSFPEESLSCGSNDLVEVEREIVTCYYRNGAITNSDHGEEPMWKSFTMKLGQITIK